MEDSYQMSRTYSILSASIFNRFGHGPDRVQIDVEFPDGAGTNASFIIELSPIDEMPHSIFLFLKQVDRGLWNEKGFHLNTPSILQATPESVDAVIAQEALNANGYTSFEEAGLAALSFVEHHDSLPRDEWAVAFASKGPEFYINKVDNIGDGTCFGVIREGRDAVKKMYDLPTEDQEKGFKLKKPVRILKATILAIQDTDLSFCTA